MCAAYQFPACPHPDYRYVSPPVSGRSAAWLARPSGGREVESSNLSGPTIAKTVRGASGLAGGFLFETLVLPRKARP